MEVPLFHGHKVTTNMRYQFKIYLINWKWLYTHIKEFNLLLDTAYCRSREWAANLPYKDIVAMVWYVLMKYCTEYVALQITHIITWHNFVDIINIEGILPKGTYPPCLRMADRALLAGYPRYTDGVFIPKPCYCRYTLHALFPYQTSTICNIIWRWGML